MTPTSEPAQAVNGSLACGSYIIAAQLWVGAFVGVPVVGVAVVGTLVVGAGVVGEPVGATVLKHGSLSVHA